MGPPRYKIVFVAPNRKMNPGLNPLTLSMIGTDAAYMHPCFKINEVEKALDRMTGKLGFYRVNDFDLPAVFTYEFEDLRLTVMTTPKIFHEDRLCYALSGVLVVSDEWSSEIAPLGQKDQDQEISTWRNHPKDFYLDLLDAVASLRPDMWLPEGRRKLLGPATTEITPPVRHITCIEWQG